MRSRSASSRSLRSWILAMFVSSLISSAGITGGSLLEKKSLSAVATAFTGMSNSLIETPASATNDDRHLDNGSRSLKQRVRQAEKEGGKD